MEQEKIDRINTLYHKLKATGLTEAETLEREALKQEYIQSIRNNMRASLNNVSIKEADGSVTDLGKKHGNIKSE